MGSVDDEYSEYKNIFCDIGKSRIFHCRKDTMISMCFQMCSLIPWKQLSCLRGLIQISFVQIKFSSWFLETQLFAY